MGSILFSQIDIINVSTWTNHGIEDWIFIETARIQYSKHWVAENYSWMEMEYCQLSEIFLLLF